MTENTNPSSSSPSSNSPAQHVSPVVSPHVIQLDSINDSKIIGVSVYSTQAEITRLFTFGVKAGQNHLEVHHLPLLMDQDSFRVEGRGAAIIHDVTLSQMPRSWANAQQAPCKSLKQLALKNTEKTIERTKRSITCLEAYLSSVTAQYVEPVKLADVLKQYDEAAESLDKRVVELEAQKSDIESQILTEISKVTQGADYSAHLSMKASINVFADFEGEIKITLIYVVNIASWSAGYDVRVDMQTKDKPIQMVYKAAITQNTGESWDDVPLTLETAKPAIGLSVPTLKPWALSIYKPPVAPSISNNDVVPTAYSSGYSPPAHYASSRRRTSETATVYQQFLHAPVRHTIADVSSDGGISATFSVPGLISVPSDGIAHNVTIAELTLDATMSWLCIPKQDTKTHIKATIKNAPEYPLLPGKASVYIDGSFISKTSIPLVSPGESFDCPLGVDPSIRVTYHPRSKKTSRSGFYTKSTNYVYQQRITIHNTKTQILEGFKVLDQFPISENSDITVKHINPPLVLPSSQSINSITGGAVWDEPLSVKISSNVVAQWDGADEAEKGEIPVDLVGKEGKVAWICSVPAGSKLGLMLHWEVSTPVDTVVTGL